MNTSLKTRIARVAGSIAASLLITVTGLQLIANYALPEQGPAGVEVVATSTATVR